jgi:hypothetical protein
MAIRTIIRGDSYGIRRPLFTITIVDGSSNPFNLASCTLRTTYKPVATDPTADPNDTGAPIKHFITINSGGTVTSNSGLFLVGAATAGVVQERLSSTESRAMPLNTELLSDVELTDANGEVFTWLFTDTLRAVDGITNRTT